MTPRPSISPQRAVRDLQWSLVSPTLLAGHQPSDDELRKAVDGFDFTTVDAAALARFLSVAPTRRVGRYFEQLVHYWLAHICGHRILAHGQQVRDAGRTIGEIDFLFRDCSGQLHHWETAVKFYLHVAGPTPTGDRLVGPNPLDSFQRKVTRLFSHQLPLSDRLVEEPIRRHAFLKGRIFYHPKTPVSAIPLPDALSPSHLRGIWIRGHELEWFDERPASDRFSLLHKPHWLAPERREHGYISLLDALSAQRLLAEHFRRSSEAVLLSVLRPGARHYEERERLFVVADAWPGT